MATKAILVENEGFQSSGFGSKASTVAGDIGQQDACLISAEEFTDGAGFKIGHINFADTVTTGDFAQIVGHFNAIQNRGNTVADGVLVGELLQIKADSAQNYANFGFIGKAVQPSTGADQVGTVADFHGTVYFPPDWQGSKPTLNSAVWIFDQGSAGVAQTYAVYIANQTGSTEALGVLSDALIKIANDTSSTSETTGALTVTGGISTQENLSVGKNINIKGGANGRVGRDTLVGGVAQVNNTSITSNTRIMITPDATGGVVGVLGERMSVRDPGVSFTVQSTIPTDTNTFTWMLFEEI